MSDQEPRSDHHPEGRNVFNDHELPIVKHAKEIKETARENDSFIIVGETGSGKTTQLPLMLREVIGPEDKIAITQPRRVAARSVARYVADQVGCRVGEEVGYNVRFEDRTTEGTQINFMTDGILLRKMQNDPLLQEYSIVMVDEVHERSLNIDLTIGLLKRLQAKRAEAGLSPLKIAVTSATLEKEKLAQYFDGSPVIEVPGRLHPVDVHYEERTPYDYMRAAAERTQKIIQDGTEGDVLIFMPGAEEIDKTIQQIQRLGLQDVVILPLHGQLSPEDQDRIFDRSDRRRKIIVSTNVAETSVTVPGVRHVIDSGLIKQIEFNPHTGIESLVTVPHAKSGSVQRAGRAGRISPGECYRLYTEADFSQRREFQLPEIQRSDLAHVVLTMKQIGINDVESFDFIDPPDKAQLTHAVDTLRILGALDEHGSLTEVGKVMAELPLEPHIARMVIEAEKRGCVEQVCTIAAFLGGRNVMVRPREKQWEADAAHEQFKAKSSDFLTLLNIWKAYEGNRFNDNWARDNFLNAKALAEVRDVRYQLFRALRRNGIQAAENEDPDAIGKSIASGLVENLLEYYSRHSYRRVKDSATSFFIHPSSVAFGGDPKFVVPAEIVETSKTFARVCQVVKPEWIADIAPQLIREEPRNTSYDPSTDRVVRSFDLYLKGGYNPYSTEQRELTGDEAVDVFAQALASGSIALPFVAHNNEVLARLKDLYVRSAGETTQPLSTQQLAEMYRGRLQTVGTRKELEAALTAGTLDLTVKLDEYIPVEVQEQITKDNPDIVQIGETAYSVIYADSGWGTDRFSARIQIPAGNVLRLSEMPNIPSGKPITVEVVDREGSAYRLFEGKELEELQRKAKEFLVKQQWDSWRYTQPVETLQQRLSGFDPTSEVPTMPGRLQFGTDPQTSEPLYAYPAVTVDNSHYSEKTYSIRYYPTEAEAQRAQEKVNEISRQIMESQRLEQERVELTPIVRSQYSEVSSALDEIRYDTYESMGLTYDEWNRMRDQLRQAGYMIEQDPKTAQQTLSEVQEKLRSSQQAAAERRRQFEAVLEPFQPRLKNVRETMATLGEITDNHSSYSLPTGIVEASRRWQELDRAIAQGNTDPAEAETVISRIEQQLTHTNLRLLKDYVETTTQKNWGIYGRVEIRDGQVFAVSSYGEREPIGSIEIGRSGRTFYISRGRGGEAVFRPSGYWGEEIILPPGSYAIGRDGSYAYSVRFSDNGEVEEVLGKPIGEIVSEDQDEREIRLAEERSRLTPSPYPDTNEGTTLSEEELEDSPFAAAFARARIRGSDLSRTNEALQNTSTSRIASVNTPESTIVTGSSAQETREQPDTSTTLLGDIQARGNDSLVEEVQTLMQRNIKPRKRAFIQATLIGRGPEAMGEAKISEAEFPAIFQQLRLAAQEAERGYNNTAAQELKVTLRKVEDMYAAIKASRSELAREYIGSSTEDLQRFQAIFVSLIQNREAPPKDNELSDLVEQAVDQMTS